MNRYHTIPILLTAVDSDLPEIDVPCGTCTLCCERLTPNLTPEEISSGLYPLSLTQPSAEQLAENPKLGPIVTLHRHRNGGCAMFVDGACTIYAHRPRACRQFDCRQNHHPRIPNMADPA